MHTVPQNPFRGGNIPPPPRRGQMLLNLSVVLGLSFAVFLLSSNMLLESGEASSMRGITIQDEEIVNWKELAEEDDDDVMVVAKKDEDGPWDAQRVGKRGILKVDVKRVVEGADVGEDGNEEDDDVMVVAKKVENGPWVPGRVGKSGVVDVDAERVVEEEADEGDDGDEEDDDDVVVMVAKKDENGPRPPERVGKRKIDAKRVVGKEEGVEGEDGDGEEDDDDMVVSAKKDEDGPRPPERVVKSGVLRVDAERVVVEEADEWEDGDEEEDDDDVVVSAKKDKDGPRPPERVGKSGVVKIDTKRVVEEEADGGGERDEEEEDEALRIKTKGVVEEDEEKEDVVKIDTQRDTEEDVSTINTERVTGEEEDVLAIKTKPVIKEEDGDEEEDDVLSIKTKRVVEEEDIVDDHLVTINAKLAIEELDIVEDEDDRGRLKEIAMDDDDADDLVVEKRTKADEQDDDDDHLDKKVSVVNKKERLPPVPNAEVPPVVPDDNKPTANKPIFKPVNDDSDDDNIVEEEDDHGDIITTVQENPLRKGGDIAEEGEVLEKDDEFPITVDKKSNNDGDNDDIIPPPPSNPQHGNPESEASDDDVADKEIPIVQKTSLTKNGKDGNVHKPKTISDDIITGLDQKDKSKVFVFDKRLVNTEDTLTEIPHDAPIKRGGDEQEDDDDEIDQAEVDPGESIVFTPPPPSPTMTPTGKAESTKVQTHSDSEDKPVGCDFIRIKAYCDERVDCKWQSPKSVTKGFYCIESNPVESVAADGMASDVENDQVDDLKLDVEVAVIAPPLKNVFRTSSPTMIVKTESVEEDMEEDIAVGDDDVSEEDEADDSKLNACSMIRQKSLCQLRTECKWKYPVTYTVGKYCVIREVTFQIALEKRQVFDPVATGSVPFVEEDMTQNRLISTLKTPDTAGLTMDLLKKDMTCKLHPECETRANVSRIWGKAMPIDYSQAACCENHPRLRNLFLQVTTFLKSQGIPWWLSAGNMNSFLVNNGFMMPWDNKVTVEFAIFGSKTASDWASRNTLRSNATTRTKVLRTAKWEFASKILQFNDLNANAPFVIRACAERFSLEKSKPSSYSPEWLNAKRNGAAACYVTPKVSQIPNSKTPEYFVASHLDESEKLMAPSVMLIPRVLRAASSSSCLEMWRPSLLPEDVFPAIPIHLVFPTVRCAGTGDWQGFPNVLRCPKKTMSYYAYNNFEKFANSSAISTDDISEFRNFVTGDFCKRSLPK